MSKPTDVRVVGTRLFFIPIRMRVPLKFGAETVTSVTCARACVRVVDSKGRTAEGWGETPLSVQWVWPSRLSYERRLETLRQFCVRLAGACVSCGKSGHPIEIGHGFQEEVLPGLLNELNAELEGDRRGASVPVDGERVVGTLCATCAPEPASDPLTPSLSPSEGERGRFMDRESMPWLAELVCCSVFDVALHDAFGNLLQRPVYETYGPEFMSRDLAAFIEPATDAGISFRGRFPQEFLLSRRAEKLPAWHLVGGLDPLDKSELRGDEPADGYPVLLADRIRRDGLKCLKIKLRGNDGDWDFRRVIEVGRIGTEQGVDHLTADFNCTVSEPAYVNDILDRIALEHARVFAMLLYVEQPFPYELEQHRIDVHGVSARKPLFLDESAHDWRLVRLGRELGWTGVALKTCKTQTGALLSACWAKAHGMQLMVQDLTNPMLAQIPHALLAAHVGTIMGVETNASQFYPAASEPEAAVHPGLYRRRDGMIDLATLAGAGFGYRVAEIRRELPRPVVEF